jgi:hypothetical protein
MFSANLPLCFVHLPSKFFLELWTDIVRTSALRVRAEENILMPSPPPVKDAQSEGTVFDELVIQYTRLTDRAEEMVSQHVYSEVEVELRVHLFRLVEMHLTDRRRSFLIAAKAILIKVPFKLIPRTLRSRRRCSPRYLSCLLTLPSFSLFYHRRRSRRFIGVSRPAFLHTSYRG